MVSKASIGCNKAKPIAARSGLLIGWQLLVRHGEERPAERKRGARKKAVFQPRLSLGTVPCVCRILANLKNG
jgi:hypothetical protein